MIYLLTVLLLTALDEGGNDGLSAIELYHFTDRYCIRTDGDHQLTWGLAESDGWVVLDPSQFEGLSLPGARQLRGYETVREGVRLRVLTANNRFRG